MRAGAARMRALMARKAARPARRAPHLFYSMKILYMACRCRVWPEMLDNSAHGGPGGLAEILPGLKMACRGSSTRAKLCGSAGEYGWQAAEMKNQLYRHRSSAHGSSALLMAACCGEVTRIKPRWRGISQ